MLNLIDVTEENVDTCNPHDDGAKESCSPDDACSPDYSYCNPD